MSIKRIALVATALGLALPAGAAAHITATPAEAPADSYTTLEFEVPHGCEESPTNQIRVQIPETVPQATPEVHPGWSLTTREGPKDEVELHGETITRGVSEVIWTAEDAPLPAHYLDRFAISVKLPASEGETVYFPTVQKCEKGQTGWIEIPAEGESAEELESPAPQVTLTAAADEPATAVEPPEDDGDGMAIAALVVGGLGLAIGGASLLRNHKGA
jgi:periplasmic copper chaperone A